MIKILLLIAIFSISSASQLPAEMVRYVDESGKPHYVNTEYSTVPEQYRSQVEEQLKALKDEEQKNDQPMPLTADEIKEPVPQIPAAAQEKAIALFIKKDCAQCMLEAAILNKEGAVFTTFDIETAEGKAEHAKIGSPDLPAAKIGDEIVLGFNPSRVIALAQGKEIPPPVKTAPNRNFINPFQK